MRKWFWMQIQELLFESYKTNHIRMFIAESTDFSSSFSMLKLILKKYFNYNIRTNDIGYGKYGKPYLKNTNIHYNISHSGSYLVVAISTMEIGVDIQIVKKKIMWDYFFSEDEISLVKKSFNDYNLGFSVLWSCKESYLKKIGSGLVVDFSTILFKVLSEFIYYDGNIINWTILERGSEQYVLSFCLGSDYYDKF